MWRVKMVPDAAAEYQQLPGRERAAMQEAFQKLKAEGDQLGAPHTSKVQGVEATLRELRPRRGSSPYRALYRRVGDEIAIGAICPEAVKDRRGFNRAETLALMRLDEFDEATEVP